MKLKILLLVVLIATSQAVAQNSETVDHINIDSAPTKSYIVNTYGTISGVTINGSSGAFFLKANPQPNGVPSPNKNFIRTETLLEAVSNAADITTLPVDKKNTAFTYFDGTGRSLQTVNVKSSPSFKDVISFNVYDAFGREVKKHLPYTFTGAGSFRNNAEAEVNSFYNGTPAIPVDTEPYAIQEFEDSPLNQVKQSYSAGWNWHHDTESNPVKNSFKLNAAGEVEKITWSGSGVPVIEPSYPAKFLSVTEVSDEAGQVRKTYTNFKGQVVLERVGAGTIWHDTYTVYDVRGNVSFVFPPEASAMLTSYHTMTSTAKQTFLDTWAFQYKYDERSRVIAKRIPGMQGWINMIYDSWDRLVLTQDPVQQSTNQWTFTKYDIFNRPIITGFTTGSLSTLQTNAKNSTVRFETRQNNSIGYTNVSFPPHSEANLLTITYYDNYDFINYTSWEDGAGLSYTPVSESETEFVSVSSAWGVSYPVVKGYTTGTKVKKVGDTKWLNSVTYYDKEYHIIQSISENHLGGRDVVSKAYDFVGKEILSKRTHTSPGVSLWVKETYSYDHAQRLEKLYHQVQGGSPVLMVSNSYNELGQLIEKNIHSVDEGVNFLQSVDMRYNIQGWVTHINNSTLTNDGVTNNDTGDLFGMEIVYNQSVSLNGTTYVTNKMYDGNISAIKWKTDTKEPSVTPTERIYGFKYDPFKRFNSAYYATKNAGAWTGNPGVYNESVVSYDKNGNIGGTAGTPAVALSRFGMVNGASAQLDNLTYRYSGNQLKNIVDNSNENAGFVNKPGISLSTDEYVYDDNGNMTEDMNRGITSIEYNHLNLPTTIQFSRPGGQIDKLLYTYDALGNKLEKIVIVDGDELWRTDYVSGFQFDKEPNKNRKLSFLSTPEGRLVDKGNGYEYEYFYKDHQNNVRLVYGSAKSTTSYFATMEDDAAVNGYEEAEFKNIDNRRTLAYNYTKPSDKVLSPNESVLCLPSDPIGPAKKLRVNAGDAVYMEVFARYQVSAGPTPIGASVLVNALTAASTFAIPNSGETVKLYNGFSTTAPSLAEWNSASTIPKAYLAYIFVDDDQNVIDLKSDADPISTAGYDAFEKLTGSVKIEESGWLYIYTANESAGSTSMVYFDDMYIVHQQNNTALQVFQASDYYPYGLSFNEYHLDQLKNTGTETQPLYEPTLRNRYTFQNQESQNDLDLGWLHYKYRMHDPSSGRFHNLDPLSEKYLYNSVYAFSENRLIDGIELEGAEFTTSPTIGMSWGTTLYDAGIGSYNFMTNDVPNYISNMSSFAWNGVTTIGHGMTYLGLGEDTPAFPYTTGWHKWGTNETYETVRSGVGTYGNTIKTLGYAEMGGAVFRIGGAGYSAMFGRTAADVNSLSQTVNTALRPLENGAVTGGRSLVSMTDETFSQALFNGAESVGGYSIYGTKGMVGNTFNRNIFLIETSNKSLSGFRSLINTMESEAVGLGAKQISIYGSSVINQGFLNPNIAARFGYSFGQTDSGVVLQKILN